MNNTENINNDNSNESLIIIKNNTKSSKTTDSNKTNNYYLHATGECDLNGRTYIALPASLNTNNPDIKKKIQSYITEFT